MCLDYMKIEKKIYYLLKKNTGKTPYGLNNGDCMQLSNFPSSQDIEKVF